MKKLTTIVLVVRMLMALSCVLASIYMCIKGMGGWGWFLVIGIFLGASFDLTYEDEEGGVK